MPRGKLSFWITTFQELIAPPNSVTLSEYNAPLLDFLTQTKPVY